MSTNNKNFKVKNGLEVAGSGTFGGPISVGEPVDSTHAVTKDYVDNVSLTPGPTGPTGSDGIEVGPTAPADVDILWLDTEVSGVMGQGPTGPAGADGATGPTGPAPDTSVYATKVYADEAAANAVASIVDSAPGTLNTLNELAAAINDDASYAATITAALGNKQDKVSGVSDTEIGYLDGVTSAIQTQIDQKAPITQEVVGQGSNYTFQASDKGKFFYVGGTVTLTIPGNVFSAGDQIDIVNDASGVITFSGSGLTIRSKASKVTVNTQYAGASIKFLSPTVAYLIGDLA